MLWKRVACIVLTITLLLADSGQMLFAHTCLRSKHTTVSLLQEKKCCKEDAQTGACSFKPTSCCQTSSKYIRQAVAVQVHATDELKLSPTFFGCNEIFDVYTHMGSPVHPLLPLPVLSLGKSHISLTQTFRC